MSQTEITEKFFGAKPNYEDLDFSDPSARFSSLTYSLKWFSNFFENRKSLPFITSWIKKQRHFQISPEELQGLSKNFGLFCPTFYSLMRMEDIGWILSKKEIGQIQEHLVEVGNSKFVEERGIQAQMMENLLSEGDGGSEIVLSSPSAPTSSASGSKPSPKTFSIEKVNSTILSELEGMYDTWLFAKKPSDRNEAYDLNAKIQSNEIKGTFAMNLIRDWIQNKLGELLAVRDKTDPELVEGYSTLKRINLNNVVSKLQELLSNIEVVKTNTRNLASANRKPKARKEISAQKLVSAMKYKPQDTELGITSVSPESIIGSKTVYLFNPKYNAITVLNSSEDEGFSVRGSTIIGINETLSYTQKLRKPTEIIQFVLSSSARTKIDSQLKGLTTKSYPASGRVNENTIILKIMKQ